MAPRVSPGMRIFLKVHRSIRSVMTDASTWRSSSEDPPVRTRLTILGDVECGIYSVSKDSFCQNVVPDVRPVTVCQPVSPSKSQFIEKPEDIPRMPFI